MELGTVEIIQERVEKLEWDKPEVKRAYMV